MPPSDARELKQLRDENAKLKRLVADLSLDKVMLQDVVQKNESRAFTQPDLWARNSVAYAHTPEAVAVRFLVTW
jgi:hypothetical protein